MAARPLVRRIAPTLLVGALLAIVTVILLSRAGALDAELSAAPDEAAHYVTALMIRGYLADSLGSDPRAFAERYYMQYPKVAFGIWPPLFHVTLGLWLFLTTGSTGAAILFVGLTMACLALLVFTSARPWLGAPPAAAAALIFIAVPPIQMVTASVMMDALYGLLMFAATIAFGRYMYTERTWDALAFGVLASLAVLTKYNSLALALVPPLAIAMGSRWRLLRRWNFWFSALVVVVIAGPWYAYSWNLVLYATERPPELHDHVAAALYNTRVLVVGSGLVFLPFFLCGLWSLVGRPRDQQRLYWIAILAMLCSAWLFHAVLYPITGARYLVPGFAGYLAFSMLGVQWVAQRLPVQRVLGMPTFAVLMLGVLVVFAVTAFNIPTKPRPGFAAAADSLLARGFPTDVTALVSSDPIGEGALIAHVATREPRNRRIVLRASKLLAEGTWMGEGYALKYPTIDRLNEALDRARVTYIVLDQAFREPHQRQLRTIVEAKDTWTLMERFSGQRVDRSVAVVDLYRRLRPLPDGRPEFEIDMGHSLGATLRRDK